MSNLRLGMSLSDSGYLSTDKINKPTPCLWNTLSWQVLCTQFCDLQGLVVSSKVILKDEAVMIPGFGWDFCGLKSAYVLNFTITAEHHNEAEEKLRAPSFSFFRPTDDQVYSAVRSLLQRTRVTQAVLVCFHTEMSQSCLY
jgi:hypothetical protein